MVSFVNLHFAPLKLLFRRGKPEEITRNDKRLSRLSISSIHTSFFLVFIIACFPGIHIHICNQQSWFAAKSSKFAAASGIKPAFEAQPVCCASSSKQNLQKKKKTRRDQQVTWKLVNHRMHCSKKDNKKQQTNDMKKATFLENGNPYLLLH